MQTKDSERLSVMMSVAQGQHVCRSSSEPRPKPQNIMYHGTSRNAADCILQLGFKQSSDGMLGRGVYLSRDLQKASRYPLELPESQRVVIKVKVNVRRVIEINRQGHPMQKTWHDHGYDMAWCPAKCDMLPSGPEEDCVWDPSRITVTDVIHPKVALQEFVGMWSEKDFLPPGQPHLSSISRPSDHRDYTMYHGTSKENKASFQIEGLRQSSDGILGRGVYLCRDLQKASRYPLELPESQRVVIKVKVNVGRVIEINRQGHPLQKTWHDHGYDMAWCPPNCGMVKSGLEEDCVWNPSRITVTDVIHPKVALQGCTSASDFYLISQPNKALQF